MFALLTYEIKVAVALAVFYMFYRLLLKKETFHKLNRAVLVGTVLMSFILPFCIITVKKAVPMQLSSLESTLSTIESSQSPIEVVASQSWLPIVLCAVFVAGLAFVILRIIVSILSIYRIVRSGEVVREEDGCKIIVTGRDIDPFSWMKYIVVSRKDLDSAAILTHEKAHIKYGHSPELLLVDILSAFQWFNPAIWMLRSDLQEIHEYQADDAVLRSGANLKEYQYLLIRKAVGKSGYSVANSFNHSILKNRITMMSKSRSPLSRGLRVLYVLPLLCLCLGLQARTVYVPSSKDSENIVAQEKNNLILVLNLTADGKIDTGGSQVDISDAKSLIGMVNDVFPSSTVVQIVAQPTVKMEVVEKLKKELRNIGVQRVLYSTSTEGETVADKMAVVPQTEPAGKPSKPQAESPAINREDICVALLNSMDKLFFMDRPAENAEEVVKRGSDFMRTHGAKSMFLVRVDRWTSYGAYISLQDALHRVYDQVRNDKANEVFSKPFDELSDVERQEIVSLYPINIVETESK